MKDRIKLIMEKENLTPAKFADRLQINRAIISHILTGRNNPSLDVVTKILSEMNYINTEWLLNGTGSMYKEGFTVSTPPESPDLFNQTVFPANRFGEADRKPGEMGVNYAELNRQETKNQHVESIKSNVRKITQIIIYYDDNTFEVFAPHLMK